LLEHGNYLAFYDTIIPYFLAIVEGFVNRAEMEPEAVKEQTAEPEPVPEPEQEEEQAEEQEIQVEELSL
ncbi:hypothetical protein SAMN02910317_02483, partial [Ruminococcaceae bacterium FB2012]